MGSWPRQLLDTGNAATAFFVAKRSVGGCTGPGGCTLEPLPFRRLLGVLLQAWGDREAAVCSSTSRLADEAVIRQCVCVSLSFAVFFNYNLGGNF